MGRRCRGSAADGEPGRHLLAALDHAHGVVLGQVDVGAKTNEIPRLTTLLDRIDLTGAIVTADAMHAQRARAEYLVGSRGAHYVLTLKGSQPNLHAQLTALPWQRVAVGAPPPTARRQDTLVHRNRPPHDVADPLGP